MVKHDNMNRSMTSKFNKLTAFKVFLFGILTSLPHRNQVVASIAQSSSNNDNNIFLTNGQLKRPNTAKHLIRHLSEDNEEHDSHDSHGGDIEWAGIFDTPDDSYIWIAQKKDGSYADSTMKLAALPLSVAASEKELENIHEEGEHAMENCFLLNHGETIIPVMDTCYLLKFDDNRWETTFPIDASNATSIAFFAQHMPTEFEEDTHYLKLVSSGEDIQPVAEESGHHDDDEEGKPWGKALGASVLINLVTLTGLILVVPFVSTALKKADPTFVYASFASFAAGAILACAFFLLLFEATHLIADGWAEETDQIWRWGTMILLGLILPVIVETAIGHIKPAEKDASESNKDVENEENYIDDAPTDSSSIEESPFAAKSFSEKARVVFAICLGDFMHNLCDGFFVGAAFKQCGGSMAWGITAATVLHELPQELSDYLILTGPQVGLSSLMALLINFLTGTSVILGTVIVLAVDVPDSTIGLLLAFGGGVYLQIGCVECMPKMVSHALTPARKLFCILMFIIGAVLIGLVLLDHEHCGGHDGHGHEGHGH